MGSTHDEFVDVPSSGLGPPRFSLRTLFWSVGLIAISIVVWQAAGPAMGIALLLALLTVIGHVAGNAIGTQLRDQGTRYSVAAWRRAESKGGTIRHPRRPDDVQPHHFAPVTRLSRRASLGWFPFVVTILGAIGGAIGGYTCLRRMYPDVATVSTLALGSFATSLLGGFFFFWLTSLLQVFFGAWRQAHRHGRER